MYEASNDHLGREGCVTFTMFGISECSAAAVGPYFLQSSNYMNNKMLELKLACSGIVSYYGDRGSKNVKNM